MKLRRRPRCSLFAALSALAFAVGALPLAHAQDTPYEALPQRDYESNSPDELLPGLVEPGLSRRAVPTLDTPDAPPGYVPLFRLTRPYYDRLGSTPPPSVPIPPDPSVFRPVTINAPPLGLQPRTDRSGLVEWYPWFGIAQAFDSNVNLSSENEIADFYFTPRAGLEFQLGTADSIFIEQYDTITALHGSYEGYGDLYYGHPDLSAYNQKLELSARIGRSAAIWRPFLQFSDLTGSNLQLAELVNRARRIRAQGGIFAEYKFTELTSYRQTFSYFTFQHPDPAYIDSNVWRTRQELTYRALHDMRTLLWAEYRYTNVTRGSDGGELLAGAGWQGRPDPRLYSELWLGWGSLDLQSSVPGRRDLSGLRFEGYTTFDWGPRFRLTLRYDRSYVFNELDVNDNYVSTLVQMKGEFFLGGNWYLTPYFGAAIDEFETSARRNFQWRPELELSYAFASETAPNTSRTFLKSGYVHSQTLSGSGAPISGFRVSLGWDWRF